MEPYDCVLIIVFFEGWVDGVDGVSELGWELGWGSDETWIDDTWVDMDR